MAKEDKWLEFVRVYEGSNSTGEVAEKMGITKTTVSSKAAELRRNSIPLKRFARGFKKIEINVSEIHAELAKLRKTTVAKVKADGVETVAEVKKNAKAIQDKIAKGGKRRGRPSKK